MILSQQQFKYNNNLIMIHKYLIVIRIPDDIYLGSGMERKRKKAKTY